MPQQKTMSAYPPVVYSPICTILFHSKHGYGIISVVQIGMAIFTCVGYVLQESSSMYRKKPSGKVFSTARFLIPLLVLVLLILAWRAFVNAPEALGYLQQ